MKVRLLTGASVLALAVAIPASAQAAGTVVAGPLKVRGYDMTVIGTDHGSKDAVTVLFTRNAGKGQQQHIYTFSKKMRVTTTRISGKLGRFGAINLRLRGARTLSKKKALPKGCTGSAGKAKTGTMTGSFKLVADRRFFRTVKAKKLRAVVSTSSKIRCSGQGGSSPAGDGDGDGAAKGEPTLMHTKTVDGGSFVFTATRGGQRAIQTENPETTAPAMIMHALSGVGPSLTVAGGGATATVTSAGRFVGGTGTFVASGPAVGPAVIGTLSGTLVAKFDSIAPVTIAGDATLMNP